MIYTQTGTNHVPVTATLLYQWNHHGVTSVNSLETNSETCHIVLKSVNALKCLDLLEMQCMLYQM